MTSLALMHSVPSPIHSGGGLRPPLLPLYWPQGWGELLLSLILLVPWLILLPPWTVTLWRCGQDLGR